MISILALFATELLGVPYVWGGNNPMEGLDCSGFVQIPLKKVKILDKNTDYSSQSLYYFLKDQGYPDSEPGEDVILFFGEDVDHITHIAIAITDILMIEAANGSRRMRLPQHAIDKQAKVEYNFIDRRNDLVAAIKVDYFQSRLTRSVYGDPEERN